MFKLPWAFSQVIASVMFHMNSLKEKNSVFWHWFCPLFWSVLTHSFLVVILNVESCFLSYYKRCIWLLRTLRYPAWWDSKLSTFEKEVINVLVFNYVYSVFRIDHLFNLLCLYWVDRAAAAAMSKRNADGSLPLEDHVIELEDQSGRQVKLGSETDQRYGAYWVLLLLFFTVWLDSQMWT